MDPHTTATKTDLSVMNQQDCKLTACSPVLFALRHQYEAQVASLVAGCPYMSAPVFFGAVSEAMGQ